MKKIIIVTTLLCGMYLVQAQENRVFYYHNNEKIYLDKIENTKVIHFGKSVESSQRDYICSRLKDSGYIIKEISPFIYSVSGNSTQFEDTHVISTIKERSNVLYISDMLMYRDSTIQWLSNEIIVKIHPESDLHDILSKNKIPVVDFRQLGYCKQTYVVELNVTENNAIEYANMLSETGYVVWAQPSFWKLIRKQNAYYSSQWGLNNTSQYGGTSGIDIKAEQAWNIATGLGVKVAVIDEGVDLTHPDLAGNLLPGYDATDAVYGGSNGGYGGNASVADAHGTACSGIIAAEDNTIGVKGVAYNAKIIPIRIAYGIVSCNWFSGCEDKWITNDTWIADGINKAWYDYGADVLSNSWNGGSELYATEEAINTALKQGRNGKGCVVVFASGNNSISDVLYPSDINPNILVVGAMSPCGERKSFRSCDGEEWGGNYGDKLDMVAPGVLVATTDIRGSTGYNSEVPVHLNKGGNKITSDFPNQDYTVWFNGTSAACPHVAGVVALVLSVNPSLTGKQVRNMIESTCQKINVHDPISNPNGYTYTNNPSVRPNGFWNNEVGYGLVDAYAAVQKAITCASTIVNFTGTVTTPITVTTTTTITSCGDINVQYVKVQNGAKLILDAGGNINVQYVNVINNSTLILDAGNETTIISDFEVELGSEFEIK